MHDIGRRRAWAIWVTALSVYVLAVFHRSSLGVAGLVATDRFGVGATELATFTVLQLVVYAGMQVPVGVLLDRFGSRALLLSGLLLMTGGQLAFAFTTSYPAALLARGVIGAGDAMVFVSVIRLVALWFLVRQVPVVTQLTGQVGQLGAVVAAAPLAWALQALGWTAAFGLASSIGVVLLVAVLVLVRDSPYARSGTERLKLAALGRSLRAVWGNPGTRLGLWSHFVSQFSMTVFTLLWGYPFLVEGQGLSPGLAGGLLTAMTGWVLVVGLVLGHLVSRHPFYRSWLVVGIVTAIAASWAVVLLWPGPAPLPVLVVMVLVTATGGPASMVGFDLARSFTAVSAVGRTNGVVNVGGFTASLLTAWLVGLVLDLRSGGTATYSLADFKVALSVQYLFWGLGVVQVLRYRRRAIAHLDRWHPGATAVMRSGQPWTPDAARDRDEPHGSPGAV
nr:MFS transporter [Nocardioides perillae]